MANILRATLWSFLVIFLASAALAIVGIVHVWFWPVSNDAPKDLPYLGWLVGSVIAEVVGVVVLLARRGLQYMPRVESHKAEADTLTFMHRLIHKGSTVTIVSNRAAWLQRSPDIVQTITAKSRAGTLVEVIVSRLENDEFRKRLLDAGVALYETGDAAPEARFTLVNGKRTGAEVLAIARGTHPDHEVTVFDSASGPQIIAMAKDIVRALKRKHLADAA